MIAVKGEVQYRAIASGVWVLVSDTGETYELYKPSENLRQEGLRVKVKGKIRSDIMTVAMVGKVLDVVEIYVI